MNILQILLCLPLHFRVDYVINPWMRVGTVNLDRAQEQWEALAQAYQMAGIQVSVIEQAEDCPDMVFAADQGIWLEEKTFLLSNFRYPERQKETAYYKAWFLKHGYTLKLIEEPGIFFEGNGDCLLWQPGVYFMGAGYRNSQESEQVLRRVTGKEFLPLRLVNEKFYHLDTCLCIIDEQTALYYPPAFDADGLALLKRSFPRLKAVPEMEANNFALNNVAHRGLIFMQQGNPVTKQILEEWGLWPVELDVSEFMKSGGGIHCLGQVLGWSAS